MRNRIARIDLFRFRSHMGFRKWDNSGNFPAWTLTLGAMADGGKEVRYGCNKCGRHGTINLKRLLAAEGRDYSLINRRSPCRLHGCEGWVRFFYSHGRMVPMWDSKTADRWCEWEWQERQRRWAEEAEQRKREQAGELVRQAAREAERIKQLKRH